jgi:D-alanine transaminase
MSLTAWVNGAFLPLEKAYVHVEDRGFQFADGVYEVIACYSGRFLELGAHLQRLKHSCDAIQLPLPRPLDELEALIRETYARNRLEDAMLYVQVTRGTAPRAHVPINDISPTLVITARPLSAPDDERLFYGVAAITLDDIRWQRCDIKSIALLASVLGKQEAHRHGAQETIWLDENQHALEGCSTNIFAVIDGVLTTHPLDHQVLGGITRSMALRAAHACRIPVQERPWSLHEANLSECMMSSTTNAIMPITEVDAQAIGNGKPGPVALQLRNWMLKEMERLQGEND